MATDERARPGHYLLLALIVALALALRLYGISWDEGYLFHPDERQILVIVDELTFPWPPDATLLTPESGWNPGFFAYGSLPIYLLRICASLVGQVNEEYASLMSSYMVGRALSALFDVGSVVLIYLLGRKLYGTWVGLLGAALLSLTVLHIQLSHFYTVDTVLTFWVLLVLLAAVGVVREPRWTKAWPLGIAFGLALATKVSAAPLAVPIALAWVFGMLGARQDPLYPLRRGATRLWRVFLGGGLTAVVALLTFVLCQPYAVIDVVQFVTDVAQEGNMARGALDIPYTRQFIGRLPYLYPIWQSVVWSLGIPLGVAGWSAVLAACVQVAVVVSRRRWRHAGELLVPLSWALVYFGLVGSFHVKFLRYLLPITPLLCLWAAWGLVALARGRRYGPVVLRMAGVALLIVVLALTGVYAAAYMHLYQRPHTWVQATAWLCENLPRPSSIVGEHWDDPLPLIQGTGALRCYRQHIRSDFPAYDRDDTAKLEKLLDLIEHNDYIILSSNRLYNTIPRLPDRYPLSSRYYELLLGEKLGFELVYYAAEYPQIGPLRLVDDTFSDPPLPIPKLIAEREQGLPSLNLGRADESYSVYDHPKPLIFAKTKQLSRAELLALFGAAAENLPPPRSAS